MFSIVFSWITFADQLARVAPLNCYEFCNLMCSLFKKFFYNTFCHSTASINNNSTSRESDFRALDCVHLSQHQHNFHKRVGGKLSIWFDFPIDATTMHLRDATQILLRNFNYKIKKKKQKNQQKRRKNALRKK